MKYLQKILIILLIKIFVVVICFEGETCNLDDGASGICTAIANCTAAQDSIKQGIFPQHCGFNGSTPIVCCKTTNEFQNEFQLPPRKDVFCAGTFAITYSIGTGGVDSLAREFPHMAALGYSNNGKIVWACGGTLISKEYVLTAAHCINTRNLGDVKYVRLGDLNLASSTDEADPQDFTVVSRIKHPNYKSPSQYHDIALVKLDRQAQLNPYVIPACLNTKREITNGIFSATGWGQLEYGGTQADHLQKMTINVVENKKCRDDFKHISKRRLMNGIVDDLQICAGAPKVDTCQGDSGGPFQKHTGDGKVVYGVTSFGIACGLTNKPGVYTRVSHYIDWIKMAMKN